MTFKVSFGSIPVMVLIMYCFMSMKFPMYRSLYLRALYAMNMGITIAAKEIVTFSIWRRLTKSYALSGSCQGYGKEYTYLYDYSFNYRTCSDCLVCCRI